MKPTIKKLFVLFVSYKYLYTKGSFQTSKILKLFYIGNFFLYVSFSYKYLYGKKTFEKMNN